MIIQSVMLILSVFIAGALARRRATNDLDRDLDFTILYKVHQPKRRESRGRDAIPTRKMDELLHYLEKEAQVAADRRLRTSTSKRMKQLLDYAVLSKVMREKGSDGNSADSGVAPELLALLDRANSRRKSHRHRL